LHDFGAWTWASSIRVSCRGWRKGIAWPGAVGFDLRAERGETAGGAANVLEAGGARAARVRVSFIRSVTSRFRRA